MNKSFQPNELESLLEIIPGVLYRIDFRTNTEGNFVYLNSKIQELTGYSSEEFISGDVNWFKLIVEEDLSLVKQATRSIKNPDYRLEYRIRDKNNIVHWVLCQGKNTIHEGKSIFSSGVILDITASKLQKEELELRQKELNSLVTSLDDVIILIDEKGCIKNYFAKDWRSLMLPPSAFLHKTILEAFSSLPYYAELFETTYRKAVAKHENVEIEYDVKEEDDTRWFRARFINQDEPGTVSVLIEDITLQKKSTLALEKSERLLRWASETAKIGGWELDLNTMTLWWADEIYNIREVEKSTPPTVTEAFSYYEESAKPIMEEALQNAIKVGIPWNIEIPITTAKGNKKWIRDIGIPEMKNGMCIALRGIMIDITEQKQLIAELETATARAIESDKLKSAFLANISHEIRTPMNAIMGFVELLDKPNLPSEKRELFHKLIQARSQDLLSIVNDILDISKIEAGQISTINVKGNIIEFFEGLLQNYNTETSHLYDKNIALKLHHNLLKDEATIVADFIKLNQVVANLLTNATKFTDKGIITIDCSLSSSKDELLFSVHDTGIGIPADQLEMIFKPFHQANASIHLNYGGSGLGLAICKGLVNSWGGKIWVKSQLNLGSTFYFTMPYVPATCNEAALPNESTQSLHTY